MKTAAQVVIFDQGLAEQVPGRHFRSSTFRATTSVPSLQVSDGKLMAWYSIQNLTSETKMEDSSRRKNPLTYPKSDAPFSAALFQSPSAEYRGCPLWSWNNELNASELLRQVDDFKTMGMGGFHIHSRVGLDTKYLGDDFMACVKACVEKAGRQQMLACLYDEDRWPSGCAGGLVVAGKSEYKLQHLLLTPLPYGHLG